MENNISIVEKAEEKKERKTENNETKKNGKKSMYLSYMFVFVCVRKTWLHVPH